MALKCTYADCDKDATRIMATAPGQVQCHFVAPYCDEHAESVRQEGGLPACGPGLSEAAEKIGGIR